MREVYTYWWIGYTDAGETAECVLCGDRQPVNSDGDADVFVRRHRACGGDAA